MEFIGPLKFEKIVGLLDSEEKVKEAGSVLEKSTEKSFAEMDLAGARSWQEAREIVLD